jgi:uncharacterized membrane protein YgcG
MPDMNVLGRAASFSRSGWGKRSAVFLLSFTLLFATWPQNLAAQQAAPPAPPYNQQTPQQLQQLVAPIALYPDSLVAQILAASTFPEQVVQADRWVQAHPDLQGDALGQAVDQQPWDPSVKALAAFPSVLGNMDKNLSWTSSLGDAYYNQQAEVMDAVQSMRRRAQEAGNLKTTPQQTVTTQNGTVVIQPAAPEVVYVPAYDPWLVYGGPIVAWPGWYPYPGIWFGGPYLSFGAGFGIGFFGGFGWGWPHWGFDWHNRAALYNNSRYYSQSRTFYNRSSFYQGRGGAVARGNVANRPANGNMGARGALANRAGVAPRPFNGNAQAARGYAAPRGQSGIRSGAFSGYEHGGQAKGYSSRGSASLGSGAGHGGGGGGGARGGGGGGAHGGGGHR